MTNIATQVKNLNKDEVKKVSKQLAKTLAINIAIGVAVTVSVTLISGAILAKVAPVDETPAE